MRVSNDENSVFVSGTLSGAPELSHSLYGEDFYAAELLVPRLSGTMDHVPITVPGKSLQLIPEAGGRIAVWGQLRTYNRHTEQGTHLFVTVFVKDAESMTEDELPRNEVSLTGYLCKPAVFRTTPFSREIGDMLIACNRSFNKSDYLPCIAWGKNAREVSALPVGSRVYIRGRIQSRRYQKQLEDGTAQDRTAHEVSCSAVELI